MSAIDRAAEIIKTADIAPDGLGGDLLPDECRHIAQALAAAGLLAINEIRTTASHHGGDAPCDDCSGPNVIWHTDDLLWNRVVRDHGPDRILCLDCFIARAEALYAVPSWRLAIAAELIAKESRSCGPVVMLGNTARDQRPGVTFTSVDLASRGET